MPETWTVGDEALWVQGPKYVPPTPVVIVAVYESGLIGVQPTGERLVYQGDEFRTIAKAMSKKDLQLFLSVGDTLRMDVRNEDRPLKEPGPPEPKEIRVYAPPGTFVRIYWITAAGKIEEESKHYRSIT